MHNTKVKRRRGLWVATCSCGWTKQTVSGFGGWSEVRRHLGRVQAAPGVMSEPVATSEADRAHGGPSGEAPPRRPRRAIS
jgi:hypothetical protein